MAGQTRDRSKIKERREAREKEKQQGQMVRIGAVVAVILVLGVLAFYSLQSAQGSDVAQARLELDPVLGNPDAPVTIVEYAAFGCEACRQWHEVGVIDDIMAQFPGQVKFIFRDMPIINPSWDQSMGEIAQCAFDQGNDAFWLAHDTIYEDTDQGRTGQNEAVDLVLADNPALDGDALRECLSANTHVNTVHYDRTRAEATGIRGTPTWFINGQQVYSASPATMIQIIQSQLDS